MIVPLIHRMHRLRRSGDVDDRQAAVAQRHAGRAPHPGTVRPAMGQHVAHPLDPQRIDRLDRAAYEKCPQSRTCGAPLIHAARPVHPFAELGGGWSGNAAMAAAGSLAGASSADRISIAVGRAVSSSRSCMVSSFSRDALPPVQSPVRNQVSATPPMRAQRLQPFARDAIGRGLAECQRHSVSGGSAPSPNAPASRPSSCAA